MNQLLLILLVFYLVVGAGIPVWGGPLPPDSLSEDRPSTFDELQKLPDSLEALVLTQCEFRSDDLKDLLRFKNLKRLEIGNPDYTISWRDWRMRDVMICQPNCGLRNQGRDNPLLRSKFRWKSPKVLGSQ
jgi:hypothetical protein